MIQIVKFFILGDGNLLKVDHIIYFPFEVGGRQTGFCAVSQSVLREICKVIFCVIMVSKCRCHPP